MRYGVDVSEQVQIEVDVGPGAPPLAGASLTFIAESEPELRAILERFGGAEMFSLAPSVALQVRYGIPVTVDGEPTGARMTLYVRTEAVSPADVLAIKVEAEARAGDRHEMLAAGLLVGGGR